jgi:hypothetical protein
VLAQTVHLAIESWAGLFLGFFNTHALFVVLQHVDTRTPLQVQVMLSLSRPKRMHFLGSDGYKYRFLSKPNDDLRRDMRVMEYANLLNRLFADDPATAQRGMKVRSFCFTLATFRREAVLGLKLIAGSGPDHGCRSACENGASILHGSSILQQFALRQASSC